MEFLSALFAGRSTVAVTALALLLAAVFALSTSATAQSINYPYNPDSDTDQNIGTPDLLSLLTIFGGEFLPDPIAIDSLTLEEYLQLLQESIAEANAALDAIPGPDCDPCDGLSEVTFGTTTYPVVPIGCECWFAKNLDTYVFANGDIIPALADVDAEVDDTWQAWANNNPIDGARFGRMYSAGARSDARKICPSGWKVPEHEDIEALEAEIGGDHGSARLLMLPQDELTGMDYLTNVDATNDFGFNGVPLSEFFFEGGYFGNLVNSSSYWGGAQHRYGFNGPSGYFSIDGANESVLAVRCVKYQENDRGCTDPEFLEFEPNAALDDGSCLTPIVRGCMDSEANNYASDANVDAGSCVYGLQPPACDFLSEYNYWGHTYPLIEVAGNCWFGENLRTEKFSNGDSIPLFEEGVTPIDEPWRLPITPWISLDDDDLFGMGYNLQSSLDERNVCPSGWHVSSASDWIQLAEHFHGFMMLPFHINAAGIASNESGYWSVPVTHTNRAGLGILPALEVDALDLDSWLGSGTRVYYSLAHPDGKMMYIQSGYQNMSSFIYEHDSTTGDLNQFGIPIRCVKD